MRELLFNVVEQKLNKNATCDFNGIVRGTKGYLYTVFDFSDEWGSYKKAAVFYRYPDEEFPIPIINNRCQVPTEVCKYNKWKIRIVGESNEGVRITTNIQEVTQI